MDKLYNIYISFHSVIKFRLILYINLILSFPSEEFEFHYAYYRSPIIAIKGSQETLYLYFKGNHMEFIRFFSD